MQQTRILPHHSREFSYSVRAVEIQIFLSYTLGDWHYNHINGDLLIFTGAKMISVCMAVYNGEKFIKEQVDSILAQLADCDELIISDDGSSDKTIQILKSYNDPRIKILFHTQKKDFSKIKYNKNYYLATDNFENALKSAKGDYIFLSDQDDIWKSDRVKKMISTLQKENADCVMCNFSTINEDGKITKEFGFEKNPIKKTLLGKIIKSRFVGSSMAFTKELLAKTLPFPKNLRAHDLWIGCFAKKFVFLNEALTLFRRHQSNVSTGIAKSENPLWYKIYYRIKFFFQFVSFNSKNHQKGSQK